MPTRTHKHSFVLLREQKGLRQIDLAKAGGVTRGYISHIEQRRRRNVSVDCLLGIWDTYRRDCVRLELTFETLARDCAGV